MFVSRKNKIIEQIREIFAQTDESREDLKNRMSSLEERENQIQEYISQTEENTTSIIEYGAQNVEEETQLLHMLDAFSNEFQNAMKEYQQMEELVKENQEAVTNLVEDNKHYTTPSKYLTEAPGKFKEEYQSYEEKIEDVAECARAINVQALSAAIEAGRLGESGKKFVAASEELRQMAADCEKTALLMKEELQASQERVQELEDYMFRLVALLKEGNVGTSRLMKKYMTLYKAVEQSTMRDFSEDVVLMRDKVVAICNLDEEILKVSERNKIQLTDAQEEYQTEKQELKEIKKDLDDIFDDVEEKFIQNDLLMPK